MESHVGADQLRHGTVMSMRFGHNTLAVSESMTHSVGYSAISGKMSFHSTVFAPTAFPPCNLAFLFRGERL